MTTIKTFCKDLKPRRVKGYRCDLRKCQGTLAECSVSCKKKSMIFNEARHRDRKPARSSASDTSTESDESE